MIRATAKKILNIILKLLQQVLSVQIFEVISLKSL